MHPPGTGGRRGLLLFDLDGTLYRGDDPYWYYARAISRSMAPSRAEAFLADVAGFFGGERAVAANDGWEAVVALASRPDPPDRNRFWDAFLATRAFMLTPACRLEVPSGLPGLLFEARKRVRVAVATQSPRDTSLRLLSRLGLIDRFDDIATEAGKPEELPLLVRRWVGGVSPERVMTVGDHYPNDIAPGWEAGWHTVHISPWGLVPGPAEVRVRRLEQAYPAIRRFIEGEGG